MQKSIINVRRSSICWRFEELDNGRQKTRNHGYDVIVGGELFTDYPITPANLPSNLKLKSTGAGRYQLLSRCGMPTASSWPERLLSESQDAALQQIKMRRFTYD